MRYAIRHIPNEGPVPASFMGRLNYCAGELGVTVDRLVAVIRNRRLNRRALFMRKRSRRRHLLVNPKARRQRMFGQKAIYSGEGELRPLLRVIDMSVVDFCKLAGIEESAFYRWYGYPLHPWPIELARYYGWSQAMAQKLRSLGVDPEPLKPQLPTRTMPTGQYPRTAEQAPRFQAPE